MRRTLENPCCRRGLATIDECYAHENGVCVDCRWVNEHQGRAVHADAQLDAYRDEAAS